MASFNRVVLMGNLTRDPEIKYMPSGTAVATFGLAVNRRYTSKDGERKEEVDFFDIETWSKTAELCSEYLNKGRSVLVEGRLKQDRWEDENGNKHSRLKIIAQTVQFLGGKGEVPGAGDIQMNGLSESRTDDQPPF